MGRNEPSASPLEPVAGAVGPAAIEAFKTLGNQTRLAILLALWDAYEPFAERNTLTFSALMDAVGYDTSGNFSYHLQQLEGEFVASTDEGYRLKEAGHKLVRTVIAGTGLVEHTLEPTTIDAECTICGGSLAITYRDELLYTVCQECPGRFAADESTPPGTVMGFAFDPAGLSRSSAESVFAASILRAMQKFTLQMGGVCPECSGPVDATIHVCEDHQPEPLCPSCGRSDELQARWVCTVCKNAGHGPPGGNLVLHPRVVTFYMNRGLAVGYSAADFASIVRMLEAMADHETELVSRDPVRVRVRISYAGDELRLLVDETLRVVDCSD